MATATRRKEVRSVVNAYILIQTEVGRAAQVAKEVAKIQGVEGITRTLTCPVVHL